MKGLVERCLDGVAHFLWWRRRTSIRLVGTQCFFLFYALAGLLKVVCLFRFFAHFHAKSIPSIFRRRNCSIFAFSTGLLTLPKESAKNQFLCIFLQMHIFNAIYIFN